LPFPDPLLGRIHKDIHDLIGTGPAKLFEDACKLMEDPFYRQNLHNISHLVGHLLRETESALRDVLMGEREEGNKDCSDNEKHKKEIRYIISYLFEEYSDEDKEKLIEKWQKLQLFKLAHRRALENPRPFKEARSTWEKFIEIIGIVLQKMREKYTEIIFPKLDEILQTNKPSEGAKILRNNIPYNLIAHRYFFEKLDKPEWLGALKSKEFFKRIPEPEREGDLIRYVEWSQAKYLKKMAHRKPQEVANIIRELEPTTNLYAVADLVKAMIKMPPKASISLMNKVEEWINNPFLPYPLPERVAELAVHLAENGYVDKSIDLMKKLLALEYKQKHFIDIKWSETVGRFDSWDYEEILKKYYSQIINAGKLDAMKGLCDVLNDILNKQYSSQDAIGDDSSIVWRPAIEDHEQNHPTNPYIDSLVVSIRDSLKNMIKESIISLREVVDMLRIYHFAIFHRIAIHLIREFGKKNMDLVKEILLDKNLFDNVLVQHEYCLLLREYFRELKTEEQIKILNWIEQGPEKEIIHEISNHKIDATEAIEVWQRDKLSCINSEDLPEEWQKMYDELATKYGKPEHPEFPVYTKTQIGSISPIDKSEIQEMSIDEIISFLKEWKPDNKDFFGPSKEGLSSRLREVISEEPAKFAKEANKFEDVEPVYLESIFSGFGEALKSGKVFKWRQILELAKSISSKASKQESFKNVCRNVAFLLRDLMKTCAFKKPSLLDVSEKDIMLEVLNNLLKIEDEYKGNNDLYMTMFNSTRCVALQALIYYGLWFVKTNTEGIKNLNGIPELKLILEEIFYEEKSVEMLSIFGMHFTDLLAIDKEWTQKNIDRIFLTGSEEGIGMFQASFGAFLDFNRPLSDSLNILRDKYEYAIKNINSFRIETAKSLVRHIFAYYLNGIIKLEDELFNLFWINSPKELRKYAIDFTGRSLKDINNECILQRAQNLLNYRLKELKRSEKDILEEFSTIGAWFMSDALDFEWLLDKLFELLGIGVKIDRSSIVLIIRRMNQKVRDYPKKTIICLKKLLEQRREAIIGHFSIFRLKGILKEGLKHEESREEAVKVVNILPFPRLQHQPLCSVFSVGS